jgi:hypothetical protein
MISAIHPTLIRIVIRNGVADASGVALQEQTPVGQTAVI